MVINSVLNLRFEKILFFNITFLFYKLKTYKISITILSWPATHRGWSGAFVPVTRDVGILFI
jgi:hypothetical protein